MKVALDLNSGEALEVALLEGDRVVGTLSLRLSGLGGSASRAGRSAVAPKESSATGTTTQRKPRRKMSPETKAKMAAAQKARWEKLRGADNPGNQGDNSGNQGDNQ